MERNNPINSVYLVALASVAISSQLTSLLNAVILGVATLAVYYIALSIVSMVDKITDNHVRFILYTFIASALVVILKLTTQYIGIKEVVFASQNIEVIIIPCLILGISPIYFESTYSAKRYVAMFILVGLAMVLMFALVGGIVELFGRGTIAGYALNVPTAEFFNQSYGIYMIIATVAILFNVVRRAYIKKQKRKETMVEKYKIIIRELQEQHVEVDYTEFSNKGGNE